MDELEVSKYGAPELFCNQDRSMIWAERHTVRRLEAQKRRVKRLGNKVSQLDKDELAFLTTINDYAMDGGLFTTLLYGVPLKMNDAVLSFCSELLTLEGLSGTYNKGRTLMCILCGSNEQAVQYIGGIESQIATTIFEYKMSEDWTPKGLIDALFDPEQGIWWKQLAGSSHSIYDMQRRFSRNLSPLHTTHSLAKNLKISNMEWVEPLLKVPGIYL